MGSGVVGIDVDCVHRIRRTQSNGGRSTQVQNRRRSRQNGFPQRGRGSEAGGKSRMRGMLAIIIEYGDQKLRKPAKIKVGKKLKGIQSDMNSGMKEVLTEEQWTQYEAYKEAKKQESSS